MSQSYSLDHLNMNVVQYDYSHLPASCQEDFLSFFLLDFGIEKKLLNTPLFVDIIVHIFPASGQTTAGGVLL